MFNIALNSIQAINDDNVRYDLFMDLLDSNVKFLPHYDQKDRFFSKFNPTYKDDYTNKFSQSIQLNKSIMTNILLSNR